MKFTLSIIIVLLLTSCFYKVEKYIEICPIGSVVAISGQIDTRFDASGKGLEGTETEGWAICNGQNRTPDLRNRFLVGAGDEYNQHAYGGEKMHILTEIEMPKHKHNINDPGHTHLYDDYYKKSEKSDDANDKWVGSNTITFIERVSKQSTTGITVQNAGAGIAHENRPPYYALFLIMRIDW